MFGRHNRANGRPFAAAGRFSLRQYRRVSSPQEFDRRLAAQTDA
jgi:hypothetical protein